jgi:hypothetical protein
MKSSIARTATDHTSFEHDELDGERGFQIALMRNGLLETRWVTYDDDGAWLVYSSHWKESMGKKRTLQERDLTPEDIHMIETLVQEALA